LIARAAEKQRLHELFVRLNSKGTSKTTKSRIQEKRKKRKELKRKAKLSWSDQPPIIKQEHHPPVTRNPSVHPRRFLPIPPSPKDKRHHWGNQSNDGTYSDIGDTKLRKQKRQEELIDELIRDMYDIEYRKQKHMAIKESQQKAEEARQHKIQAEKSKYRVDLLAFLHTLILTLL